MNGDTQKQKDMVSILGRMEIDMKENGRLASSTAKELTSSQMETVTPANITKENQKAKVNTFGAMVASTTVNLKVA